MLSKKTDFSCQSCGTTQNKYTHKLCKKCCRLVKHYARGLCRQCYRNEQDQRETTKKYGYKYRQKHRILLCQKEQKRRLANPIKCCNAVKASYYKNKQRVFYYKKQKYYSNVQYKILCLMRSRFTKILKNIKQQHKYYRTEKLLGADINTVRQHLEKQFLPGMTWDNHGDWHIDHIKPCALFDLTQKCQQLQCFHYTNLQPLWAMDNIKKGKKYGTKEHKN